MLTAIVPFRSLDGGKSRLAGPLCAGERQRLCTWMLENTLQLLDGVAQAIVVTDDARVSHFMDGVHGATRFLQAEHAGDLNRALDQARLCVAAESSIVVVPTDLVCLDRLTLLDFVGDGELLKIAPDRARQGTNLLHLPAACVPAFRFAFGIGSFERHQAEARRMGFEPHAFRSARTAFDLDTPEDLARVDRHNCLSRERQLPVSQ